MRVLVWEYATDKQRIVVYDPERSREENDAECDRLDRETARREKAGEKVNGQSRILSREEAYGSQHGVSAGGVGNGSGSAGLERSA